MLKKLFNKNLGQSQKEEDMVSVFTRPRIDELPADTSKVSSITLGSDVEFSGSLSFKDKLNINGKFEGDLCSEGGLLIIGKDAEVKADIKVGNLIAKGKVYGNITAYDKVELHDQAHIFGNIEASRLSMEEGVILVGNINVNPSSIEPETEIEDIKPKKSFVKDEDLLENQIKF